MKIRRIVRGIAIALILAAFAAAISTCSSHKRVIPSLKGAGGTQPREIALADALAELDALPVPEGVKPEVFQQLQDALEKALICRAGTNDSSAAVPAVMKGVRIDGRDARPTGKFTSTPPTGDVNRVNDLAITDNGNGTYSLTWHYRNLGDYNQDGAVGIADITPLAVRFSETWTVGEEDSLTAVVDGSGNKTVDIADVTPIAVHFGAQVDHYSVEASDTADSGFTAITTCPLPASDGISRTSVSYSLGASPAYTYWRVVPVDADSVQGDYSNVAQVGDFVWHLKTLDTLGAGSGYTSLVVVNGNPAVAYEDYDNGDLRFVRATVASGTTWGTPITLDSAAYTGEYCSMAIVNGKPAVSYYDADNGNLRYVLASDADGTNWADPITVTSDGNIGQFTSLAVVDGKPAISYYDVIGLRLMYVRAEDADGTIWGAPVLVDDAGNVGQYSSMEVVNGRPAIAYYNATNANRDLKYVRASGCGRNCLGPARCGSDRRRHRLVRMLESSQRQSRDFVL